MQSTAQNIRFEQVTVADGLSGSRVGAIGQDGRGFLWIGTNNGLNRWDGVEMRAFKHVPGDSTSLSHNFIHSVVGQPDGSVWIGTRDGLNVFDPVTETFTSYRHDSDDPESIGARGVLGVALDEHGHVWAGVNGGGLIRLDPATGKITHFRHDPTDPHSIPSDVVRPVHVDSFGRIWAATIAGLAMLDPETSRFTTYAHDRSDPNSIAGNRVLALDEDASGRLIVGMWNGGIDRFNPREVDNGVAARFEHIRHAPSLGLDDEVRNIRALKLDGTGTLWAATWSRGLNRIDSGDFESGIRTPKYFTATPGDPYSLSDTDVISVFEDRDGILWFGTNAGGISRFDGRTTQFGHVYSVPISTGVANLSNVTALVGSSDGALWIGAWESGLYRIDPSSRRVTSWRSDQADSGSLHSNRVTTLFEISPGRMWVGTSDNGLAELNVATGRFSPFTGDANDPSSLPVRSISSIIRTRDSRLLIGAGSGAHWFDPATQSFDRIGGHDQPDRNVMDVLEDASGALWIAHDIHGLKRIDPVTGAVERFRSEENDVRSLSSSFVRRLHEDARGRIWVATTHGLDLYIPESRDFERIDITAGLRADEIRSITEDDRGRLWLGTNRGLTVFDPYARTFVSYDESDGLHGTGFSTAAFRSDSGHLWFGGSGGYNVFHPDSLSFESRSPNVAFTDLKVAGGVRIPVSARESVTLSHADRAFTIAFSALSFRNPAQNRYRYRLAGLSDKWTDLGTQNRLTLTGLSPGAYSLEVVGANSDGVWSEAPAVLRLDITPPWWNSRPAWLVYVLLFAAALVGARRYEMNRTRLKHRLELEAAEREKLTELDQVKSRFLANLSHEFRTPLTLIIGPLRQMIDRRTGDGAETDAHAMMLRNARRLQRLINQILDLSRLESGQMDFDPETHDLNAFVRSILRTMAPLAEREAVRLSGPEAESLPAVFDSDHMEKVLGNLLSNALKFTEREGRVDVELRATGDVAEIKVRDTGVGIPPERLPYVFDRFVQVDSSTRRQHEGSGIGLALARELMELHGGTIHAESVLGEGSTFIAVLPIGDVGDGLIVPPSVPASQVDRVEPASEDADVPGGDGQAREEATHDRTRILVVDDNADVRFFVRSLLEEEYEIIEAVDGAEGLERAQAVLPDLIIADVMMPRMDGFELSRVLKEDPMLLGVPVILLTARAAVEDELEGLETGADHYVSKPFEPDVLLARARNLLAGRRRLKALYSGARAESAPAPAPAPEPVVSAFAAALFDVIDERMTDSRFSVEMLADEMALSPSQLRRRTKDELEASPNELIRERRLNRAAQMLREGAGTVSEIGFAVGFNSLHYFSRSYSAHFGAPPSEHLAGPVRE